MTLNLDDTVISDWLFIRRTWEPYESELVRRVLRPGAKVVDVGAHIGYYTLLAASCVGAQGRVWAFEPAPDNYRLLARNVRQNHLERFVRTENCAVSDRAGETPLYLSATNYGDHRIFASDHDDDALFNQGQERRRMTVPTVSLDGYLAERAAGPIDVIKLDVQGAELNVLRGMRDTLRANPNVVLFLEYWPHGLQSAGGRPQQLLELLTDEIGLALTLIIPNARHLIPVTSEELLATQFEPSLQVDLICCRDRRALLDTLRAE
jgi:FkbM family methyltransferase